MAWTQEQLDALESAIAMGTTRVRYQDPAGGLHEKQYASLDDMLRIRGMIRAELGLSGTQASTVARHDRDI